MCTCTGVTCVLIGLGKGTSTPLHTGRRKAVNVYTCALPVFVHKLMYKLIVVLQQNMAETHFVLHFLFILWHIYGKYIDTIIIKLQRPWPLSLQTPLKGCTYLCWTACLMTICPEKQKLMNAKPRNIDPDTYASELPKQSLKTFLPPTNFDDSESVQSDVFNRNHVFLDTS